MKHKSLHDQIAFRCVHFTGLGKGKCKAGMTYDEVDKEMRVAYRAGLPCLKPDPDDLAKLDGRPQCACPHLRFPSEEEVQKELDMWKQQMEKMTTALAIINPIREKHAGKDWQGILECPNCKNKLHVTHSGYNGHVHAKCETEGCVAWME